MDRQEKTNERQVETVVMEEGLGVVCYIKQYVRLKIFLVSSKINMQYRGLLTSICIVLSEIKCTFPRLSLKVCIHCIVYNCV